MSDSKRRFRPRPQRNGFRPRNSSGSNSNGHFNPVEMEVLVETMDQ